MVQKFGSIIFLLNIIFHTTVTSSKRAMQNFVFKLSSWCLFSSWYFFGRITLFPFKTIFRKVECVLKLFQKFSSSFYLLHLKWCAVYLCKEYALHFRSDSTHRPLNKNVDHLRASVLSILLISLILSNLFKLAEALHCSSYTILITTTSFLRLIHPLRRIHGKRLSTQSRHFSIQLSDLRIYFCV